MWQAFRVIGAPFNGFRGFASLCDRFNASQLSNKEERCDLIGADGKFDQPGCEGRWGMNKRGLVEIVVKK